MASIINDPNGRKRILFIDANRKRKAIRLGKATLKQAEAFNVKVEQLVSSKILNHSPDGADRVIEIFRRSLQRDQSTPHVR